MVAWKKILDIAGFGFGIWMVARRYSSKASGTFGISFKNPVPGSTVTSGWGDSRAYRNGTHYGLDFGAAKGTPVYAAADGVVTRIVKTNSTTAGKHVIVRTTGLLASKNGMINIRYLHLDSIVDDLTVGQVVKKGQLLGKVGATYGPNSAGKTAPHLHFDMSGNQAVIDRYIEAFGLPEGGMPDARSFGIQFPCEPFIAANYKDTVRARSSSRGIEVR